MISGLLRVCEARKEISPRAAHAAKRVLLDTVGCLYGSWDARPAVIARVLARRITAQPGCAVLGSGERTAPDLAAFANGTMIRYLDFNDTFANPGGSGHPSDYIAAVLAGAQVAGGSGLDVLRGILTSYEVFSSVTAALRLGQGVLDHVTVGAIAAAAGSAAAMRLSQEQIANALSLAVAPNIALHATRLGELSMWKGCAAANAARNGVFAALLASEGLTGPPEPFLGAGGLAQLLGREIDTSFFADNGDVEAVCQTHLKRYPAGFFSQTAIDAAVQIRAANPQREISSVHLGTFGPGKLIMAGDAQKWRPATRETADHSLPYIVAVALMFGDVRIEHFGQEYLRSEPLLSLTARIDVSEDAECSRRWPREAVAKLRVRFADGGEAAAEVAHHRGHSLNPMSDSEVEQKFRLLSRDVLTDGEQDKLVSTVWSLDERASAEDLVQASIGRAICGLG